MISTTAKQRGAVRLSFQDSSGQSAVMANNDDSPDTLGAIASRQPAQWSIKALADFSDAEFEKWKLLLEEKTGIHLVPQQKAFLQAQLTIRLRELGDISLNEYAARLKDGIGGMVEWSTLTDRLVVKETSFFRHPENCDFIRELIRQRVHQGKIGESFDIWSVGCFGRFDY